MRVVMKFCMSIIPPKRFVISDVDIFLQLTLSKAGITPQIHCSLGGENRIAESWTLDYELASSSSLLRIQTMDRRVQFRERGQHCLWPWGSKDNIEGRA